MKVELKGKDIVITMPATMKNPPASKSGKTKVIATSNGNKEFQLDGKTVYVGVNVYTKE